MPREGRMRRIRESKDNGKKIRGEHDNLPVEGRWEI